MLAENSCLTAGQTNTAGSGPTAVVLQSVLHYPAHCSPSLHCRMHLQRNPPSEFVPLLCPGSARRVCRVLKWDRSSVLTSLCVEFWSETGPQSSPLSRLIWHLTVRPGTGCPNSSPVSTQSVSANIKRPNGQLSNSAVCNIRNINMLVVLSHHHLYVNVLINAIETLSTFLINCVLDCSGGYW